METQEWWKASGCLDIYYFDELFDISDTKTHQPGIIFTLRQVFFVSRDRVTGETSKTVVNQMY